MVEGSRGQGVDMVSGAGLTTALSGADAVVDASNPVPADAATEWGEALVAATRNVVRACAENQVSHMVFLSVLGIEDAAFDRFEYYLAKREQERVVGDSGLAATIVKTSQWHEFAANPAAVQFHADRVEVQDWLVQPVAADAVADVLAQEALQPSGRRRVLLTGPERIRLPELARRRLEALGDGRPVRTVEPHLPELAGSALVAPAEAEVVGPGVQEWISALR